MTTPTRACPECGGMQLLDHPAGALTFDHERTACSLGMAQDATQHADAERLSDPLDRRQSSACRPPQSRRSRRPSA